MPEKLPSGALSAKAVENAKSRPAEWALSDGNNLSLIVRPDGRKRWLVRFSIAGKRGKQWLGYYPDTSLVEARAKRDQAIGSVMAGEDPRVTKRLEKATKKQAAESTFEALAREWWKANRERWTADHAARILGSLETDAFPELGRLPIITVKAPLILSTVRRIERRGAVETAQRLLQRIGRVMRYAIANGLIGQDPTYKLSEALKGKRVEHRPAMPRSELPEYFKRLSAEPLYKLTRLALGLLALTFVRPGELRAARWKEFDFDASEWRIPAARMKMRQDHVVPLSKQALAILKELQSLSGRSPLLFPAQTDRHKPMSENTLSYALGRMGYSGIHCPHGFRALASTILNEEGFRGDVIERQLAHAERNKVRAAYHRASYLDERREMMQWWADFLDRQKRNKPSTPTKSRSAALRVVTG